MEYRTIKTASNRMEAELIKGLLDSDEIPVILKPSTEPYGGEPFFGDTGPLEILVPEDRVERVLEILREVERAIPEGGEDWEGPA